MGKLQAQPERLTMDYYDSANGVTISYARARDEIVKVHNLSEEAFGEFLEDCGNRCNYDAQEVLGWLGY